MSKCHLPIDTLLAYNPFDQNTICSAVDAEKGSNGVT
jgi:hypothetical protein